MWTDASVYLFHAYGQIAWMSLMWILCVVRHNGSMVDFGWPSGFTAMAVWYMFSGDGYWLRRVLICSLYIFCGVRFMIGWAFGRRHWIKEDHRWSYWRERWRHGQGMFGIKSVPLNFFFFYHAQSLTNIFFLSIPLHVTCFEMGRATPTELRWSEIGALCLWVTAFVMENVADVQLSKFTIRMKKEAKKLKEEQQQNPAACARIDAEGKVMDQGLWRYSRHPNYFCEFLLWCAYALYAWPSAYQTWQYVLLILVPVVAYYFLVHFTGIWMAEQVSLVRRGEAYRRYQQTTNMFFPWFPKKLAEEKAN
eukprot:TRINITY_DN4206_c0_g1_i2.p1 TRINITY_DN4206_c0_g1~~TRINITY_DN4206_c0_g1_i2.p1  ORF type:complete len:307 (+),score=79.66 TRINITY_DN4206_c0_g1_i2:85-1005(+)